MPDIQNREFGTYCFGEEIFSDDADTDFIGQSVTASGFTKGKISNLNVVIYDHTTQNKTHVLTDSMQENPIVSMSFAYTDQGCAEFKMQLEKKLEKSIGLKNWIEIFMLGSNEAWYTGIIERRPAESIEDQKALTFSGFGFINQLDTVFVDRSYSAGIEISEIVLDIFTRDIAPNTSIRFNSSNFSDTFYNIRGDIEFKNQTARQCLKRLADLANNFSFGVDERREFFFKPKSTQVNSDAIYFMGRDLSSFPIKEDPSNLANKLIVKSGAIYQGDNFTTTVQDQDSIDKYGLIPKIVTAPELKNLDDLTRWANYQLSLTKEVKEQVAISDVSFRKKKIKAEGKAKIFPTIPKRKTVVTSDAVFGDLEQTEVFTPNRIRLHYPFSYLETVYSPIPENLISDNYSLDSVTVDGVEVTQASNFLDIFGANFTTHYFLYSNYRVAVGIYSSDAQVCMHFSRTISTVIQEEVTRQEMEKTELEIKKVNYSMNNGSLKMSLQLGELDVPIEKHFIDIAREVREEATLSQSNVKELSS